MRLVGHADDDCGDYNDDDDDDGDDNVDEAFMLSLILLTLRR